MGVGQSTFELRSYSPTLPSLIVVDLALNYTPPPNQEHRKPGNAEGSRSTSASSKATTFATMMLGGSSTMLLRAVNLVPHHAKQHSVVGENMAKYVASSLCIPLIHLTYSTPT
jgi:hypothetical protein